MVGNIVIFVIGAGIGGGLVAYHKWSVQEAVRQERKEINRLRDLLHNQIVRNERTNAYSEGFDAGIKCPISDAERLVRTFASRKGGTQIRTAKED